MAILDAELGKGDKTVAEIISPALEDWRMGVRRKLVAARGSTYTYKNPDDTASRVGGNIGDDGTVHLGMGGRSGGFVSRTPGYMDRQLPDDFYNDKGEIRRRYRPGGDNYNKAWYDHATGKDSGGGSDGGSSGGSAGGGTNRRMRFKKV